MSVPGEAVWRAAESIGVNSLIRRRRPARLLIICYHAICDDDCAENHWLLIRRHTFARQLDYLRTRFQVLPLDEATEHLRAGALKLPTVAITFDDGYRNNYSVAWPELQSRGLPCTIFLTTGLISTQKTLWTTTLEYAVRGSKAPVLDLTQWSGPRCSLASEPSRIRAGYAAKEWMKNLPAVHRQEILRETMTQLAPIAAVPQVFSMMDWNEVRSLAASGLVRFGAHTVHHEVVSQLDDTALEREITDSVHAVEILGNAASRVFAYPNGREKDFDARAHRVLETVGAIAAVTTIPGTNSARTPPLLLRRLVVDESVSLARFAGEAGGIASILRDTGSHRRARINSNASRGALA
jgi:peptidoglycan/xylan/chitin deacetylase (PgdA/CDA1 family)